MKVSHFPLGVALVAILAEIASPASAEDMAACHYTTGSNAEWKLVMVRQLRLLDPKNAARLGRISADIIDGRTDTLNADLAATGTSPSATLKGQSAILDMSLLELAVAACRTDAAEDLVNMGASADGEAPYRTPLVIAAAKGEDQLAEFLIQHGARIDKRDLNGHTPLEEAVRQRQMGTIKVLLKYGANVNTSIATGSLLDLLSKPEDAAIADELKAHGAVSGVAAGGVAQP